MKTLLTQPIGALRQWHRELRAGFDGQRLDAPSTWRFDPLFRSACEEANGIDAQRAGLHRTAAKCFERAASILCIAHATRRRA